MTDRIGGLGPLGGDEQSWHFFISYTQADRSWAEWVAWQLEEAGYRILLQAWHFVPGVNWQAGMQRGVTQSERTIALLSDAYLRSVYGQQEWQAAQAADPLGFHRKLVPIRVADCDRPGLLGSVVSFDLFGLDEDAARRHLLDQIRIVLAGTGKPAVAPGFPGSATASNSPPFPGVSNPTRTSLGGRRLAWTTPLAFVLSAALLVIPADANDLPPRSETCRLQTQPAVSPTAAQTPISNASADGLWSSTGPMAVARAEHTLTTLSNGRVLAAGGWQLTSSSRTALDSAEIYDPVKKSWSTTPSMGGPRADHTATLLSDGRVLVAGGIGADNRSLATTAIYDPETNAWTSAGSLDEPRTNHRAVLLRNGDVLVVGGWGGYGHALASAELWDAFTNSWSSVASMSVPRMNPTATLLPDGRVLVSGGYSDWRVSPQSTAEIYDGRGNRWSLTASMSTTRAEHTATPLADGRVLVVGGISRVTRQPDGSYIAYYAKPSEFFVPTTGSWCAAGSPSVYYAEHTALQLTTGDIIVIGAASQLSDGPEPVDLWDPRTHSWSSAPSSIGAFRVGLAAALLLDGSVLVTGGYAVRQDGITTFASADVRRT